MAHHHYRATLAAAGVKQHRLPPALTIPRPDPWTPEPEPDATPRRPRRADNRRHAETVNEVVAVLAQAFGPGG